MDYNEFEEDYFDKHLPRRTDTIYEEIEAFKDYEFTHCIVYEMAIRNKEIRKVFHKCNQARKIHNKLHLRYMNRYFLKNQNFRGSEILGKFLKYVKELSNKLTEKLINEFLLYPNDYDTNMHPTLNNAKVIEKILEKPLSEYKINCSSNQGLVISQGISNNEPEEMDINCITTKFSRHVKDTNQINVAINMSLSEDEIVAYVKHIKKILLQYSNILKSPNKLLGNNVGEAQKTVNFPKKPSATKFADMFFIYDYVTTKLDSYSFSNSDTVIMEIFDELENVIPTNYYLKQKNKNHLNLVDDDSDKIFHELASPPYKENIKLAQRKYKKSTIHTQIDTLLNDFEKYLEPIDTSIIQKRYSVQINNPKENKIFEDLKTILHLNHIKNLHREYAHIEKTQREKLFEEMNKIINEYEISSSTISNYYYALKPYVEECRYPELLTGESLIATETNNDN